ncbi:hypothetical protein CEXT_371671 [Caerostris extrusa]|uniref:Maturase K n=1 Tax=Caerostris extrusa TaxID=172846 RepID=A0AAV4PQU0_CAEEX|nr:hypothetical protein CEXT_371671 [Caerostris extrusa]
MYTTINFSYFNQNHPTNKPAKTGLPDVHSNQFVTDVHFLLYEESIYRNYLFSEPNNANDESVKFSDQNHHLKRPSQIPLSFSILLTVVRKLIETLHLEETRYL